jgi:hypothetical protein
MMPRDPVLIRFPDPPMVGFAEIATRSRCFGCILFSNSSTRGLMTMTSATASSRHDWESDLERYRTRAVQVLDTHLPATTGCTECGDPWPCARACTAELVLEL